MIKLLASVKLGEGGRNMLMGGEQHKLIYFHLYAMIMAKWGGVIV